VAKETQEMDRRCEAAPWCPRCAGLLLGVDQDRDARDVGVGEAPTTATFRLIPRHRE
jgi:hypothetical protein